MKKTSIVIIGFLGGLLFTFSQQKTVPTVEEIYNKYITAIGGKEKLSNIVSKKEVRAISHEYEIKGQSAKQQTFIEQDIGFVDTQKSQAAYITRFIKPDGSTVLTKQLTANGKTTTLLPNGEKKVTNTLPDSFKEGCFPTTVISPGSEVLPNEIFNGTEAYVIHSKTNISHNKWDTYVYFDRDSGLLIGDKLIGKNNTLNTSYLRIREYSEYKEVQDILVFHKITQHIKSVSSNAISIKIDNRIYKVIATEFNTDIEDFKQNCFQKPEECFAQYIKK
ncbi:hypothetical protein [Sinomicrobium soli]|uniref:hypothetical protein n=1 Tax=Sinomicrobium sp. N-1-3-6 TaxID=2219864 RepID=UPI000DCCF202|nr:hypothetical protein [Sinomicrobium sp. N-1-3-6]RAV29521.1 hypothetical protein DN748_08485 [Sinomicrobium sp. N-1-3-6]